MHKIELKNVVWKEGKYYVSWNLNTSISSFGSTKKEAIEALQEALELYFEGFYFISQKGSHAKFRRPGNPTHTVILKTTKKEVPYGTFQSILLQSGLKESDFLDKRK